MTATKTGYLRKPKNSCSLVQIKCTRHWHDNKIVYVVGTGKQNNKNKCLRTLEYVLISNAVHFHAETGMITNNICSWCRQTLDKYQFSDCLTIKPWQLNARFWMYDFWFQLSWIINSQMNTIRNLSFGVATYHIQDCICFTFHPTKGEYWATEHSWRMISSGVVHGFNHHPWRHPWLVHLNSSHHCFSPSVVSTNRESGRKYKGKLRQQRIVYTLMPPPLICWARVIYIAFFQKAHPTYLQFIVST